MSKKLIAPAVAAVAAVVLTAAAAAGPSAARQQVMIVTRGGIDHFQLLPRAGSLHRDSGSAHYCCWSERVVIRDGQRVEVNDPVTTLVGKRGTLVMRERIEWLDAGNGYSIGVGTWKVVRGTGAYKGVTGSGRSASSWLPSGPVSWQNDGFLSKG